MNVRKNEGKKTTKRNTVRVIGGSLRGSKLEFPDLPSLRPTADRIRETLFNWLQNDIVGSYCIDLFAGSGALGIEAASRGASKVVLVESNAIISSAIRENLQRLKIENAQSVCAGADQWLQRSNSDGFRADIVFIDPPFADNSVYEICAILEDSTMLNPGAKIYIESGSSVELDRMPAKWSELKSKKAGKVMYYLFCSEEDV